VPAREKIDIERLDLRNSAKEDDARFLWYVHEELHHATADTSLDDSLDLVVATIGQVRQSPAGIGEDLLVGRVDETSEGGESGADELEGRLGLAAAEVGEGPGGIPEHGELGRLHQVLQERTHGAVLEDVVAALRRIAGNVTESPHSLERIHISI
jgi:hypothetical protein